MGFYSPTFLALSYFFTFSPKIFSGISVFNVIVKGSKEPEICETVSVLCTFLGFGVWLCSWRLLVCFLAAKTQNNHTEAVLLQHCLTY